jgi:hypothetical protein
LNSIGNVQGTASAAPAATQPKDARGNKQGDSDKLKRMPMQLASLSHLPKLRCSLRRRTMVTARGQQEFINRTPDLPRFPIGRGDGREQQDNDPAHPKLF